MGATRERSERGGWLDRTRAGARWHAASLWAGCSRAGRVALHPTLTDRSPLTDSIDMRRALVAASIAAVVVIGAAVVISLTTGHVPGLDCRLKSIDEAEYVAGNRAILDSLPVFPGATRTRTLSIGIPAEDKCNPISENGPPYDRYMTDDLYTLPVVGRNAVVSSWGERDVPSVLVWYDRNLRTDGWRVSNWSGCCEVVFKREPGVLISVRAALNADDPYKREPYYSVQILRD